MSIHLHNAAGNTFDLSGGHWAVYLTLAQAYGWKPRGTERPPALPASQPWSGQYASRDGQIVGDAEAKLLAQILHAAALSDKLGTALTDVINNIEEQIVRAGTPIGDAMRMQPQDFKTEFSPLLKFLYQGRFIID